MDPIKEKWIVKKLMTIEENLIFLRDKFITFSRWITQDDPSCINMINDLMNKWHKVDDTKFVVSESSKDDDISYYENVFLKGDDSQQ